MPLEILTGNDVPTLLARAQELLGEDAAVLSVRRIVDGRRFGFEMVAADPLTAQRHRLEQDSKRRMLETPAATLATGPAPAFWEMPAKSAVTRTPPIPAPHDGLRTAQPSLVRRAMASLPLYPTAPAASLVKKPRSRWPFTPAPTTRPTDRPRVIALVGPTGAGKTTTLAKLANHALGFEGRRVGLVCLDTYRVGAVEQSRHYAELSRIPFEVVWERSDVARVHKRMRDREVVLVDTPGRGPRATGDLRDVQERLVEMLPDEVHLVLPAGLDRVAARRVITAHLPLGVTHLLPSKLDEHPTSVGVFELAMQFGLPMRWLTDGQEVPRDLQAAPDLAAVGPRIRQAVGAA